MAGGDIPVEGGDFFVLSNDCRKNAKPEFLACKEGRSCFVIARKQPWTRDW